MPDRIARLAAVLGFVSSLSAVAGPIFAALDGTGTDDRYTLRFSAESGATSLSICEPNVRWSCSDAGARFRPTDSDSGPGGRRYFRSRETLLLWAGKEIHVRLRYANGSSDRQVLTIGQRKQVFGGDLTNPYVGDAKPNPKLVGSACVFATSPVPSPDGNGERGSTYPTHRTSRDYSLDDGTPIYSMGTCETVKRIDDPDEHPCGIGIAMRCRMAGEIMGVLYCHLSRPAQRKKFFGIGELVSYSGHTGTDNPHLHLGMTFDVYDHSAPRAPGLEDEELLMPGLPVPENNPDKWLRENDCYHDPVIAREGLSRTEWDGLSFLGNDVWEIHR